MDVPAGRSARVRDLAGLVIAWGAWLAMTAYSILYIGAYSRDVPFMDEFDMVPVLTGAAPLTLDWAWSQHHEHRPMISRLILVGLSRFVDRDFRTARYANVALLSAMAAAMLILSRWLRGSARATDAVLPLSILSIAQAESLMIGFAMNLVLTSFIAVALILASGIARRGEGRGLAMAFGASIVALPLCGGSGLAMVPPLAAWLVGHLAVGWWSGRTPGASTRAIGVGMLLTSSAIVALYLRSYSPPPHFPPSTSATTVASGAMRYLSLSVYPNVDGYWPPAGPILLLLLTATMGLLARVALREPVERPRALGVLAVIASMLGVAGAVGVSRGGLGPSSTILSRYVTLTSPLLAALYVAWLAHGKACARAAVHLVLLALVASTLPANDRFSRAYGRRIRVASQRVERALKDRAPAATVVDRACPILFPDRAYVHDRFRMLGAARVGAFAGFEDDPVAAAPEAAARAGR